MRLFAIGDIHGCLRELDTLLSAIAPTPADTLILLGDLIDRGPDSKGVIQRLIQVGQKTKLILLRGNHEQLLLDARFDEVSFITWIRNGGDDMLRSYGPTATLLDIPLPHLVLLSRPEIFFHETDTHIFVHGGLDPDCQMAQQTREVMLWARFLSPSPHQSGKIMVCGHSPQMSGRPANVGYAICLDTGVSFGGPLTALEIHSGLVVQAFLTGNILKTHIDDYRQIR